MFTGIIDHCGKIIHIEDKKGSLALTLDCQFDNIVPGESIALDGICVTAIEPKAKSFRCELSPETLALTTAKQWRKGQVLNLERALRLQDRVGGHFVTGHVAQTAVLTEKTALKDFLSLGFSGIPEKAMAMLVEKGSIAINGVSLTINALQEDGFYVMLIPHSLKRTNLGSIQVNQQVNIEFDYLARIVARQICQPN